MGGGRLGRAPLAARFVPQPAERSLVIPGQWGRRPSAQRSRGAGWIRFPERRSRAGAGGSCLALIGATSGLASSRPSPSPGGGGRSARPVAPPGGRSERERQHVGEPGAGSSTRSATPAGMRRDLGAGGPAVRRVHDGRPGPGPRPGSRADQRSPRRFLPRQLPATANERDEGPRGIHTRFSAAFQLVLFCFHFLLADVMCLTLYAKAVPSGGGAHARNVVMKVTGNHLNVPQWGGAGRAPGEEH